MPSANQPQDSYTSYLKVTESLVSQSSPDCPTIIVGHFNCHIGHLGGLRSSDP